MIHLSSAEVPRSRLRDPVAHASEEKTEAEVSKNLLERERRQEGLQKPRVSLTPTLAAVYKPLVLLACERPGAVVSSP
jgi:hypothetical protein